MDKTVHQEIKKAVRKKIVDIWNNPDNPPEDKLIDIFDYTIEQLFEYVDNQKN